MRFNYGITFCIIGVCCSGAAARPGSFSPSAYTNTTSSSSTLASSISTQMSSSLTSVDPTSGSSTTFTTLVPSSSSITSKSTATASSTTTSSSSITSSTSSSSTTSKSTISTQIILVDPTTSSTVANTSQSSSTVSSTASSTGSTHSLSSSTTSLSNISSSITSPFSTTSARNSSTTFTTSSTITSTTSSTTPSTTSCLATSNSTSTTDTRCQPKTLLDTTGSSCVSYCATATSFRFNVSTTTQVVTVYGNATAFQPTQIYPQSTSSLPLQPCLSLSETMTATPEFTTASLFTTAFETFTATANPGPIQPSTTQAVVISYISSKTTVTSFVTKSAPDFRSTPPPQLKVSVTPTIQHTPDTEEQSTTAGGNSLKINPTGNPSPVPPTKGNYPTQGPIQSQGLFQSHSPVQTPVVAVTGVPTPTVVNGVTVAVGSSIAVIGSSTYTIGPGATPTTTVVDEQTISIGPSGVGIGSTTLTAAGGQTPPANPGATPSTQVATLNGVTLTEIGSTVMIGSNTYTLGPQASPTTVVVNGQTFSLGPSGVGSQSTAVFPPQNGSPGQTQVITAAGITFTEIGSSVAIIGGSTFTLGAQATPTTEVIDGVTVSIGPGGVGIGGGTTLAPPAPAQTQAVTAGGITFSEIGSSLVVIGSSTFTIGPGATPTTDVFDGQTISIGPSGVGFASKAVPYVGPSPTLPTTNGAPRVWDLRNWHVWGLCVLIGVWLLV